MNQMTVWKPRKKIILVDASIIPRIARKRADRKISAKSREEIHPSGGIQIDRNNPEDTNNVKDDMKVGKGIDPAKNCISERNATEKKYSQESQMRHK